MHDIFPSGHTIIALLVMWLAKRHRVRGWPLLIPLVAGLVAATVYLRYHYGVDVLAGVAIAVVLTGTVPFFRSRYLAMQWRRTEKGDCPG